MPRGGGGYVGASPFYPPVGGAKSLSWHVLNRRLEPALYHRTTSYTGGGVGLARRRSCGAGASLRRWQHTGGVAAVYKGWRDATRQSGSRFYQPHKVSFLPLSTSSHPLPLTSSHCCRHYIVAVIIIKPHNVTFSNFKI